MTCIFNSTQSSPLSIILHLTLRIFTLPVLPLRPQRLPTPGVNDFQCIFHFQCYMVLWAGADLAFSQHKRMSTKWVNSSGKNISISFNHIFRECNFVLSQFSYVLHEFNFLKMLSMCGIEWRGRNSEELSSSLLERES